MGTREIQATSSSTDNAKILRDMKICRRIIVGVDFLMKKLRKNFHGSTLWYLTLFRQEKKHATGVRWRRQRPWSTMFICLLSFRRVFCWLLDWGRWWRYFLDREKKTSLVWLRVRKNFEISHFPIWHFGYFF